MPRRKEPPARLVRLDEESVAKLEELAGDRGATIRETFRRLYMKDIDRRWRQMKQRQAEPVA